MEFPCGSCKFQWSFGLEWQAVENSQELSLKKEKKLVQLSLQARRNKVNVLSVPEATLNDVENRLKSEFVFLEVSHISSDGRRFELRSDEEALKFLDRIHKEVISKGVGRAFIHKDEIWISIRVALKKNGIELNSGSQAGRSPQNQQGTGITVQKNEKDEPVAPQEGIPSGQPQQFVPMMNPYGGRTSP